MGQSQVYSDLGAAYKIFAGTVKSLEFIINDPATGRAKDLSDTTVFSSGYVDITYADGTLISPSISLAYIDRANGKIQATAGPYTNVQAGNWKGFIKLTNALGAIIDQQEFNFVIKESF